MKRVLLSGCGLMVVLAVVCLLPLPHRIVVPAVIDPEDARRIYVTVPGLLQHAARPGAQVAEGQMVAQLTLILR